MILKVVRSGGFAGLTAAGELDTAAQPDGERLEQIARGLDGAQLGSGRPQPDRYVYRLQVHATADTGPTEFTVAEQDLDADTAWLLDRVLQS
jgi:emfourin